MLDAQVVGAVIQRFREQKGVSQEVLSGLADIGRTHLSAIERGAGHPAQRAFGGDRGGARRTEAVTARIFTKNRKRMCTKNARDQEAAGRRSDSKGQRR